MSSSTARDSGATAEAAVSVIQYVDPAMGGDLSMLPEAMRPCVFRSYQHQDVAILVSDMSGFTRLTRKYGAIHFTSIIARTRQLCLPILHEFGAMLVTAEGDSLNAVFPTAEGAVQAALNMQHVVQEYNKTIASERAHFTLTLDGVGVAFGPGPILDREGKLHGQTFGNAHLLGEELCSKGRVAISKSCYEKIVGSFAHASFSPMPLPDNEDAHEAIEAMGSIFEVVVERPGPICVAPHDAPSCLQAPLLQFCHRHSPSISDEALEHLDAKIRRDHVQQKAVLMLDFEYMNVDSQSMELGLKFACLSRLEEILGAHNACKVEDVLYLFDRPVDAILAATKCRSYVDSFRRSVGKDAPQVAIKGFGVHVGEVLLIEGTDVHWGDPVNTASKLGQDFAANAEIIISKATYDACGGDPRLQELSFAQFELEISGVKFQPYRVTSKLWAMTNDQAKNYADWVIAAFKTADSNGDGRRLPKDVMRSFIKRLKADADDLELESLLSDASWGDDGQVLVQEFIYWVFGVGASKPGAARLLSGPGQ